MVADANARPGSLSHLVRGNAVRIANVAVLALLVVLLYRQVDLSDVRRVLGDVDPRLGAAAFALNLPVAALFSFRSHLVLARLGHRVEARLLVPAMILGNVAGSLTPASSGELLRAVALRSHADIPAKDGLALVLYERGVSVYLMAVGTGVVAALVALPPLPALAVAAAAIPLFLAPALAPALLRLIPAPGPDNGTAFIARALARVRDAADRLRSLFEDRLLLVSWSLVTAALFAVFTIQIWLLARSISDVVAPQEVWVAFGASQLAGIVSLIPLGLGAADGSLAAILRKFGLSIEQGTAVAILFRLVVTVPYGVIAILCYLYLQRLGRQRESARG